MGDQVTNAVVAVVLGSLAAVLLVLPTAALQYRRNGRLRPQDLVVLLSAAVYALSLWTYTLLPTPDADDYVCRGRQLELLGSIRGAFEASPTQLEQASQVGLNVLLFVPLGWFLRVVLGRGVVVAGVVGLATSLLVETTQTTGVWSLYDCPYRVFDVDDLVVNTLGALVGSVLAYVVLDRRDDTTPPLPTTVSLGRRLVSLASDVLFAVLLGGAAAAGYRGLTLDGPGSFDPDVEVALFLLVPYVVQAISVLGVGRTVGEHVVAVRAVARRPRLRHVARVLKLLAGVTPAFVLAGVGGREGVLGLVALAVAHVVVAWRTDQHRGLTHVVAGMDLRIATDETLPRDRDEDREGRMAR